MSRDNKVPLEDAHTSQTQFHNLQTLESISSSFFEEKKYNQITKQNAQIRSILPKVIITTNFLTETESDSVIEKVREGETDRHSETERPRDRGGKIDLS